LILLQINMTKINSPKKLSPAPGADSNNSELLKKSIDELPSPSSSSASELLVPSLVTQDFSKKSELSPSKTRQREAKPGEAKESETKQPESPKTLASDTAIFLKRKRARWLEQKNGSLPEASNPSETSEEFSGPEDDERTAPIHAKTQAEVIFSKFGSATRLHLVFLAIGRPYNKATIYKWAYPRSKGGSNGWVPTRAWPDVLAAARYFGVFITSEEMDPRSYLPKKPFK
jgi:hypothetical protein